MIAVSELVGAPSPLAPAALVSAAPLSAPRAVVCDGVPSAELLASAAGVLDPAWMTSTSVVLASGCRRWDVGLPGGRRRVSVFSLTCDQLRFLTSLSWPTADMVERVALRSPQMCAAALALAGVGERREVRLLVDALNFGAPSAASPTTAALRALDGLTEAGFDGLDHPARDVAVGLAADWSSPAADLVRCAAVCAGVAP